MPSKKGNTTPSSIPPSTNSRSVAPSSAASSQSHTDSPLKASGADATPKKGGLTFGRSSNEPYTAPKSSTSSSKPSTTTSTSSGPPKLPGSVREGQKKAQGVVAEAQDILGNIWNRYVEDTPQRVKLVDAFMAFLVALGVVQFAYCVVAGNYVCELRFLSSFHLPYLPKALLLRRYSYGTKG